MFTTPASYGTYLAALVVLWAVSTRQILPPSRLQRVPRCTGFLELLSPQQQQLLTTPVCRRALVVRIAALCAAYTAPVAAGALLELWQGHILGRYCMAWSGIAASLSASALVCRLHWPESAYPDRPLWHVFNSHALMHLLVLLEYLSEWRLLRNLQT